ncbi:LuxR family transcriptional regulator [Streptomyces tateyamensis]|uniref:LuxR family transcriptional regulator n=1 Tax=Streptomyces tateyamensis TaxID=565073 RepID=A0A2V4MYM4_9ACTN|nr:LuxR family transcriptional regulator [Streptomyces tateyamensis]
MPGEAAREFYLGVLGEGGRLRMAEVTAGQHPLVGELLELGLLTADPADGVFTAVNPRVVGGRLSEDLRSAGTRLLVQAQEMPTLLEDLSRAYDLTARKVDRSGEVLHLHETEQINARLDALFAGSADEILTAQPGSALPTPVLAQSARRTKPFLARGGAGRCLFEPAARSDGPTTAYVLEATELGARFRVLGESFKRMTIFDRHTAVIPTAADYTGLAVVDDPAVVAFLVGMFERDWQRAEPVPWSTTAPDPAALPVPAQVGRMLSQGLTQRTIATRLGLSERTVAGHISRLREQYDAQTLFQLGWLMRAAAGERRSA